ncbi:ubiquitin ligase complex F-box protein UFO1 [Kluyveromyces marxianus]|nr:ubiquitin ligase complex F-box protein UFO1 [Kluyveromyces marxianus]
MMSELSLQALPVEVLVNVFSHLEESDFRALEQTCKLFEKIVHDEELWKTLFLQKNSTLWFPSFSRANLYSIEYVERNTGLNQWRHNRATKTKYSITHDVTQQSHDISSIVFDFPRCACYNEGMVTFLQLHTKRRKDRVAYIQCTTPHGTSARHFNINAVVFGRYDGRVFGKLLTNKSYLSPVTEFDGRHFAAVTAIITTAYQDSSDDICVSGDESGEVIWWRNTHKERQLKISTHPIADLHVHKGITVAIDLETIFVIDSNSEVHSINLQKKTNVDFSACKFIKVDFGGKNIIFATLFQVYVISIDIRKDFGTTKVMNFDHPIQELSIDESTAKRERNPHLPGGDGCYISVLTEDRTVYTINVRVPGSELKYQTKLAFNENWITCQINNLVLVCAFSGMIGIYDAITGNEIRVVQNTEPYPEFLNISHGQILMGKGTTLFYYQYVSEQDNSRKKKGGNRARSNKWNENLQQQLNIYDDEEQRRIEEHNRMAKLQKKFVGDIDDEELQLKIALLESESLSNSTQQNQPHLSAGGDMNNVDGVVSELFANDEDIDEDFLRALQESTEEEYRDKLRKKRNHQPIGELQHTHAVNYMSDTESLDEETKRQIAMIDAAQEHGEQTNPENDDDLALAIALSLSQMND